MLSVGYRISGRYEILRLIGEGGMANVYLAIDIFLKRQCAVKVLRGDLSNDEKFVMRFQREAISASSLSHPNIVELYDVGEDKGKYYIVMEYIEGKTLRQLVKKRKALSVYEVVDIAKQLSSGLAHAHEKKVIHRDIKPHNIIISSDGKAKIMDFGIAMISNYSMLTNTNSIIGSVHYLSPEQVSGKGADNRSDIYSLGVVVYEMLTGEVPFTGDSAINIALEHLNNQVPSVMEQNRNVPQSLENVIRKATAKKPSNRYQNADDLYSDLDTSLSPDRADEMIFSEVSTEEIDPELEKTKVMVNDIFPKNDMPINKKKKKREKLRRSNTTLYGMIFVIAILVGLIAMVSVFIPLITASKDVVVPDVIGQNQVNAEIVLRNEGFLINSDIKYVYSDEVEEGKVIQTFPSKGTIKKEGSYIKLVVSKGLERFKLSSYIDKDINIVKKELEALGLTVEVKDEEVEANQGYTEGKISKQFPGSGASVTKGDVIQLYRPIIVSTYPDMVGKFTLELVDEFCNKYNLQCEHEFINSDSVNKGVVISQSRQEGTKIILNASFQVYISNGPASE